MAVTDIKLIRLQAMLDKKSVKIVGESDSGIKKNSGGISIRRLNLPDGWTVSGDDILISVTGFCSGGYISIKDQSGRIISFNLTSPKCDAERSV